MLNYCFIFGVGRGVHDPKRVKIGVFVDVPGEKMGLGHHIFELSKFNHKKCGIVYADVRNFSAVGVVKN